MVLRSMSLFLYSDQSLAFRLALFAAFFSLGVFEGGVFPDFFFPSLSFDIVYLFKL